jgi:hypothetical protein
MRRDPWSDATLATIRQIMKQALREILETTDACTACMTVEIGLGRPTVEVTAKQ